MIRQQATRAVDGVCNSRCDGLVDGDGPGSAMMRGGGLVWFAMRSLSVVAISFSLSLLSLAFTFALPLCDILLLLERAMSLLLDVALAVEPARAVEWWLGIHSDGLVGASVWCQRHC